MTVDRTNWGGGQLEFELIFFFFIPLKTFNIAFLFSVKHFKSLDFIFKFTSKPQSQHAVVKNNSSTDYFQTEKIGLDRSIFRLYCK